MLEIKADDVNIAYEDALWKIRIYGVKEQTMRGEVLAAPCPAFFCLTNPLRRVLFNPHRDANPFFHVMEFIWMMAGRDDTAYLETFNSRYPQFGNDGRVHGAYGRRWASNFGYNQIAEVVEILKKDPNSRRAVLGMWDPAQDLSPGFNDYPCNTHIYFRVYDGKLTMTVCNRSNDLIWGMLGANVVHMTMLQECIAAAAGLPLGDYQVFTNNLHMYTGMPRYDEIVKGGHAGSWYNSKMIQDMVPILTKGDDIRRFMLECSDFCNGNFTRLTNPWLLDVALPMNQAYKARRDKAYRAEKIALAAIDTLDWRTACQEWVERRNTSSATSTEQ